MNAGKRILLTCSVIRALVIVGWAISHCGTDQDDEFVRQQAIEVETFETAKLNPIDSVVASRDGNTERPPAAVSDNARSQEVISNVGVSKLLDDTASVETSQVDQYGQTERAESLAAFALDRQTEFEAWFEETLSDTTIDSLRAAANQESLDRTLSSSLGTSEHETEVICSDEACRLVLQRSDYRKLVRAFSQREGGFDQNLFLSVSMIGIYGDEDGHRIAHVVRKDAKFDHLL